MTKEDYIQYYIQGSDHYLIPKDIFDELYDEMNNWKQDTQKYKEVINKAREYVEKHLTDKGRFLMLNEWQVPDLLDILKEVE